MSYLKNGLFSKPDPHFSGQGSDQEPSLTLSAGDQHGLDLLSLFVHG